MTVALRATAVFLALGFLCAPRAAAQAAKNIADPAGRVVVRVRVLSVDGLAYKRAITDPGSRWVPIKPGDLLGEKTLVRTGLGAKVVLALADRGRVTVKGPTKIGIEEFQKLGKLAKVRLGLKYGSMRVFVDDRPGPNDLQVRTPVAVLSVRGCGANISFGERGLSFCVFHNQWDVQTADGRTRRVGEKECTDQDLKPWRKLLREDEHVSVAGAGKGVTVVDKDSLVENPGGRAILDFAGGDNGQWLFATPTGHSQGGSPDTPPGTSDSMGSPNGLPGCDK